MRVNNGTAAIIIIVVLVIVGFFAWRTFKAPAQLSVDQQKAMEGSMHAAPGAPGAAPAAKP